MMANFIRNVTLRPRQEIVPYTEFWGSEPTYANLRIFGCKAYVLIPKAKRTSKLNPVCEIGMMVGYPTQAKGYRILLKDVRGKYVVVAKRDVVFDETQIGMDACFPREKRGRSPPATPWLPPPAPPLRLARDDEFGSDGFSGDDANDDAPTGEALTRRVGPPPVRGRSERSERGIIRIPPNTELITIYDKDGEEYVCLVNKEEEEQDGTENHRDNKGENTGIIEPLTLEEAMSCEQAPEWLRAVNEEMASLTGNNTWEAVECPQGVNPIPCKWVLKIKRNEIGEITRYKARLVAKGFKQIPGVDFTEVSSPVVRLPTIRTVFALAAANNWKMHHLDIDTAFLHGQLRESIYMAPPEGFDFGDKVLKLHKCIYGLKQAPLIWYETLKSKFEAQGFKMSFSDASLLIHKEKETKTFAVIYVDDQTLTGPNDEMNQRVKAMILREFPGKDLGEPQFFVGIKLDRDVAVKTMKLSQTRHIDDLLKVFGQEQANPVSVPMDTSLDLTANGSAPYHTPERYMSLVGSLNYLAMSTRPDIAYATSVLCRYMSKPTQNHWNAAIRVLKYLKGTKNYGLVYGNTLTKNTGLQMTAYSDASHGDKEDSISAYGYAFLLNGAAVHWASKKEDKIAKSTAEAEYVAASFATDEALWLNKLLADCSLPKPMTMHIDNTAAVIQITDMPMRNKHIRIHYQAVFERVRNGDVLYEHIPSADMVADIFTKPLAATLFHKFRVALGVLD